MRPTGATLEVPASGISWGAVAAVGALAAVMVVRVVSVSVMVTPRIRGPTPNARAHQTGPGSRVVARQPRAPEGDRIDAVAATSCSVTQQGYKARTSRSTGVSGWSS